MSNTSLHINAGFTVFHSALEVVVEALDVKGDLLWNSIHPDYTPQTFLVDAVESLLKSHIDVKLPLPFRALFNDVVQSEDLVYASSSFLKTCLLLSELLVLCFRDLPDDELD